MRLLLRLKVAAKMPINAMNVLPFTVDSSSLGAAIPLSHPYQRASLGL
jgi:hypothetical protein